MTQPAFYTYVLSTVPLEPHLADCSGRIPPGKFARTAAAGFKNAQWAEIQ